MKIILATNNKRINEYVMSIHSDLYILSEVDTMAECIEICNLSNPDLVLVSDRLYGLAFEQLLTLLKNTKVVYITQQNEPKQKELSDKGVIILLAPVKATDLSKVLFSLSDPSNSTREPSVLAVWTPKAGDGGSFTTIHLAEALKNISEDEDKIGILDLNIKSDSLKYQLSLDFVHIIDELLPYIASGKLNSELMLECAREVFHKGSNLWYVGGVLRPELYVQYTSLQLHYIIKTAKNLFTRTVIDAGSLLDNTGTVIALKDADVILAVIHPSYVSRQLLYYSLSMFPAFGINPNKVKIVVNRFSPEIIGDNPHVIIDGLGVDLIGVLPDLGFEALTAVNRNRTVSIDNKRLVTNYTLAIKDIFEKLSLINETKKSLFSRIKSGRGA